MRLPTTAVTGPTGKLGQQVVKQLRNRGIPLRLLTRDPQRIRADDGIFPMGNDYAHPANSGQVLSGVETLFMVSGHESPQRAEQQVSFVRAAANAGVGHIVYTSFVGASDNSTFTLARDHGATEAAIKGSGMGFTLLRDSLYQDFAPDLVGEDDAIRGPAGEGRAAMVARADVAAVAAAVLAEPGAHAGRTYELTGPQALTMAEVAEAISHAWRRPVRYVDETLEEARASRARFEPEEWQLEAWISTYTAIAQGTMERISEDVPTILGRPATSLAEVLSAPQ